MTLSRQTVHGLAALCGGIPDLTFTVSTSSGGDLWVAEHPDAQLCVHAFRQAIQEWPKSQCHEPCIENVMFDEFDELGGVLSRVGERWFVSLLTADATAACLRTCADIDNSIDALVREDLEFNVSVVRLSMREPNEAVLDDAAIAGYAACLTEELTRASTRAA
ncbi:hypothetical protein [Demequina sp.]|uniref:hypothetical protein n=1 Tax=Demequina sp. TaxID=2050685 RepID=UPI003D0BCA35